MSVYDTHRVENQPPRMPERNAFSDDPLLQEIVEREGLTAARGAAERLGERVGSHEVAELARLANENTPVFRSHDRFGHRLDAIEFHPAWHALMRLGFEHDVHGRAWRGGGRGHSERTVLFYLYNQGENGTACPICMTAASLPSLRFNDSLTDEWEPRILSTQYDERFVPAHEKRGAVIGMAMTEKQGGSDVQSNTTKARATEADGEYLLTGHKWFCSSPQADGFLTLARLDAGLTCFFVPRFLPDGSKNRFFIQRLKNKLGNRSNPSSEIEYDRTWARRVGDPGRGVPTIINMVHHTRLDCVTGSAGMMRLALVHALHHTEHRQAFGKRLIEQPLMRSVLADLCLEVEAAVALTFRLARTYDGLSEEEALLGRLLAPITKYWVCKRNTPMVYEALECHGGNGYVEDLPLARLYRDAPLNGIWEGSGNVICLDVLRALRRAPAALELLLDELRGAKGQVADYDRFLTGLERSFLESEELEARARRLVEGVALAMQASLLIRHSPSSVAAAFCQSRLGEERLLNFGGLATGKDLDSILTRAWRR
ncbi:MAG: acyl-CoA dehydrogenase family protein [Myxococcota bacterium]